MENSIKERRRLSHSGMLDSVIRLVAQLAASSDISTRTLAGRALGELQRLKQDLPRRRMTDGRTLRK